MVLACPAGGPCYAVVVTVDRAVMTDAIVSFVPRYEEAISVTELIGDPWGE